MHQTLRRGFSVISNFILLFKNPVVLFLSILLIGLSLRIVAPQKYPFAFDQIQIARNSFKIFHADPVLIGPRTGPAEMFTGPLIYYIAAPFHVFLDQAYVVVATAIFISALTGCSLYFLAQRYFQPKIAIIIFFLWGFSPLLVAFDRVPWNPNLTLMAASFSFFPLFARKYSLLDVLLLSIGVFLGYQAHFSGLLLLPLVFLSFFFIEKIKLFKHFSLALLPIAFFVSLLPTIIFDYKYGWLNTKALLSFSQSEDSVSNFLFFSRLSQKTTVFFETIGKLLLDQASFTALVMLGVLCTVVVVIKIIKKELSHVYWLTLIWPVVVVILYSFYRGSTPEYYFFILLPAILLIVSQVIAQLHFKSLFLIGSLFVLYSVWSVATTLQSNGSFTLGEQQKTVAYIKSVSAQNGVKEIIYDTKPVDAEGLQYQLDLENITYDEQGKILHVLFPYSGKLLVSQRISDAVSVWADSRIEPQHNYITREKYIIKFQDSIRVLETHIPTEKEGSDVTYVVLDGDVQLGSISFYEKPDNGTYIDQVKAMTNTPITQLHNENGWLKINETTYLQDYEKTGIILTVQAETEKSLPLLITLYTN